MRYQFIDTAKEAYPVALLCEVMLVNRSGYYAWRKHGKSKRQKENEILASRIQEIHQTSKGAYGSRRMAAELEAEGHRCGRYRARTLMNLANVAVKRKRKFKVTTDSKHKLPVF
ncbi:MAG: IS3 family transposase, partial [Deltaproteobacteria bacterium]|nr:IS3 family transposase [Deltaproteobacteria bacterium]